MNVKQIIKKTLAELNPELRFEVSSQTVQWTTEIAEDFVRRLTLKAVGNMGVRKRLMGKDVALVLKERIDKNYINAILPSFEGRNKPPKKG